MTKEKRHKSKKYERYYGEPYKPKTLVEVKVCSKCGRKLPEGSVARKCPYCGDMLTKRYVKREQGGKSVAVSRDF